jgi:hypothetical protein
MSLSVDNTAPRKRDAATYAAAVLHALAREEALERRSPRVLEPHHATWKQFRGRLGWCDLLDLLLEDGAVTQPTAFTPPVDVAVAELPDALIEGWLTELGALDLTGPGADYIAEQAARLGIGTRMARSELHRLKAHHRVLEIPGSGGQLAHHLVSTHDDVYLQDVFTIACAGWRDATLAALIAVELGLSGKAPVMHDPDLREARKSERAFDYVVGLERDKGGEFKKSDLQEWFPKATVLLV